MEKRAFLAEVRAAGDDDQEKVSGLGIVYDEWVELWPGYKERIRKGAVKKADTVKSYFNHDPSKILSTLDSDPPLELKDGDKGLEYESPIPPTSYGNDLAINLKRGNVKGSSFAFKPEKQKRWEENKVYYRDITELILYEIGPVTDPAYVQTTATLRSAQEALDRWREEEQNKVKEEGVVEDRPEQASVNRLICERRQDLMESMIQ